MIPPLYLRGFLVAASNVSPPANFRPVPVPLGLQGWAEEKTLVHHAAAGPRAVTAFGTLVDTTNPMLTGDEIATSLTEALARSRDAFIARLGEINGRYAIVAGDSNGAFVVGDAGGLRSIFYGKGLVGSHAKLLADLTGSDIVEFADRIQTFGKAYRARNWPGRLSKYEGIYTLTANTLLSVPQMEVRRFFGMEPPPERSAEEAAEIVAPLLRNAAEGFVRHYLKDKGLFFLTGGIDSRLVLSGLRGHEHRFSAFTYNNASVHDEDVERARLLSEQTGMTHTVFEGGGEYSKGVSNWATLNGAGVYIGSKPLLTFAASRFSDSGYSIRGNLGEISRGVYTERKAYLDHKPRFMARVWFRGSEQNPFVMSVFEDYAAAVEIEKISWPIRIMYYWEHRHATWHAATLNELDLAFDSFNVMNSRNVIEAMCGVSLDDQRNRQVHIETIKRLNPALLSVALSNKTF